MAVPYFTFLSTAANTLFWFGLDKCQLPTKTTLSLPLLSWTGERKYDERLEVRTGRDHSPITVTDKTD